MTLLAMFAHPFFPQKVLVLFPGEAGPSAHLYMNQTHLHGTYYDWIDQSKLHWRCVIDDDEGRHLCGFNFNIGGGEGSKGLNLSGYDSLVVSLEYQGPDRRLRFYLRNYEPEFSDIEDIQTAKFNNVSIPVQFVDKSLELQLNEFSVAEWWVNQYRVPREYALPAFDHVVSFGIDLTYPASAGVHEFRLHRLELRGPLIRLQHWYAGLLLFWALGMLLVAGLYMWQLQQRVRLEHTRLHQLSLRHSALQRESERYQALSYHDHLTGLMNRRGMERWVQDQFPEGNKRSLGMILLDIDHFKHINDHFGHEHGDKVLCAVAELIRSNIRQTDQAARWGGEEFVILLPDTNLQQASRLAEKLRDLMQQQHLADKDGRAITFSAGAGCWFGNGSFDEQFHRVDKALYQAKMRGRNRVVNVDPD